MRILLLNGNTDPAITDLIAKRAQEALPRLGLPACDLVPATAGSVLPFRSRMRMGVSGLGRAWLASPGDFLLRPGVRRRMVRQCCQ